MYLLDYSSIYNSNSAIYIYILYLQQPTGDRLQIHSGKQLPLVDICPSPQLTPSGFRMFSCQVSEPLAPAFGSLQFHDFQDKLRPLPTSRCKRLLPNQIPFHWSQPMLPASIDALHWQAQNLSWNRDTGWCLPGKRVNMDKGRCQARTRTTTTTAAAATGITGTKQKHRIPTTATARLILCRTRMTIWEYWVPTLKCS